MAKVLTTSLKVNGRFYAAGTNVEDMSLEDVEVAETADILQTVLGEEEPVESDDEEE
jgi:hypothetical protein